MSAPAGVGPAGGGVAAGWRGARDRLLADRRFQRWAARCWLTRPIVRRQTRALFDLCAGFVYAQVLTACVQLALFDLLAAGPLDVAAVAAGCGLPVDAARCLLEAAGGLGLVARLRGERYALGMLGAALRANPGIGAMIRHHGLLYGELADPAALLRRPRGGTDLGGYWSYAGIARPEALSAGAVADYSALMGASQPMIADEVLAAYDFSRHRCLLDVGGGDGSFVQAVGAAVPGLQLMLFDLPAVAAIAQARLAGLMDARPGGAVWCIGGSFAGAIMQEGGLQEGGLPGGELPVGADIVSFVRVLHDHDDAVVMALLRAARAALPVGGTVLVAEPMADDGSAAAYFSLYLRAMGSGRPRRQAELAAMLKAAGFGRIRARGTPTPLLTRLLVAHV